MDTAFSSKNKEIKSIKKWIAHKKLKNLAYVTFKEQKYADQAIEKFQNWCGHLNIKYDITK